MKLENEDKVENLRDLMNTIKEEIRSNRKELAELECEVIEARKSLQGD